MTIMLQRRTLQPGEHVMQSLDDDDLEEGEDMDDEESAPMAASRTTGKKRRLTNNNLVDTHETVQEEKTQQRLAWDHQETNTYGILVQVGSVLKRLISQSRFDRYTGAWSLEVVRELWLR
jgi:hypothetical protein